LRSLSLIKAGKTRTVIYSNNWSRGYFTCLHAGKWKAYWDRKGLPKFFYSIGD
jgi:hypothetical protein